jgi:hypothetical protein
MQRVAIHVHSDCLVMTTHILSTLVFPKTNPEPLIMTLLETRVEIMI